MAETSELRYALSFTVGSLLTREATIAAPLYLQEHDWSRVRARLAADNLLQTRTTSSRIRLNREVAQRLAMLSDPELDLVIDSTGTERAHLMWVAACRRYEFIGDFAEEVVRERFLLLTPTVSYNEFDGFVRGKAIWHPELVELKDSTMQKLRSTIFQMLVEAGLTTKQGNIVRTALSDRLAALLDERSPSDIRYFPTSLDMIG
ncbi:DUF1819 family protein [Mycetocola manganoxydans]|uniref:DUF1819 family protein n=1 Tax=Mycetocola manganoxydans TaxID=699879 RepID=A0A3L6ZMI5_9MICO|nr:DUF1819 family protein [Mycetocola manganoxydans]RLP69048.1 DUF1819 family protein [Mycetocola manganoxydans]GHD51769.1 hypothetical protein GCM10008097_26970 [Mycetocola manganoxydans]